MKLALRLGSVALALLLILVIGAFLFLDSIARSAIERGGSYALGVDTTLASADVGVFSGEFALAGLKVANPPGYAEESFLELERGGLALDVGSLFGDRIEAPLLELEGVKIALERAGGGTNYDVLLENLERLQSPDAGGGTGGAPPADEDGGGGKSFVLERVVIRDVEARLRLGAAGLGAGATVTIEEIALEDLGSRSYTIAEITALVVRALLAAALSHGGDLIPSDLAGSLRASLGDLGGLNIEIASDTVDEVREVGEKLEEAGKALKGLLDR